MYGPDDIDEAMREGFRTLARAGDPALVGTFRPACGFLLDRSSPRLTPKSPQLLAIEAKQARIAHDARMRDALAARVIPFRGRRP